MAKKKKKKNNNSGIWKVILIAAIIYFGIKGMVFVKEVESVDDSFKILSSTENKVFDNEILNYFKKKKINVTIEYEDTLKIISRLNSSDQVDAIWLSNSIWLNDINSSKNYIKDSKSTSINPIIFGIKQSKAEELGLTNGDVYTADIVKAIKDGQLKFNMSNPTTTNSGASAYLGILNNLVGNPEVLTSEMLHDSMLEEQLQSFFSGVSRSSGNEDFLEKSFINGDYEAVFTYESSIININRELSSKKKEILYAVYPVDGVSIADSPVAFVDHQDESKKEIYNDFVNYLLSNDGQKMLAQYGRRTWYGGVNNNAPKDVFNPEWGIDTTKYISPIKYPSRTVIKEALKLYQESFRKPVHVVFCLDYSGSMYGDGNLQLIDAMDYILTSRANDELLQFTEKDIVEIVPFESEVLESFKAGTLEDKSILLDKIKNLEPGGATALYPAVIKGLNILKKADSDNYLLSVVVMTDGEGNVGSFSELEKKYKKLDKEIPVFSIQFAKASKTQLENIAKLTNGKVFDGTKNLIEAFKEVRGYN